MRIKREEWAYKTANVQVSTLGRAKNTKTKIISDCSSGYVNIGGGLTMKAAHYNGFGDELELEKYPFFKMTEFKENEYFINSSLGIYKALDAGSPYFEGEKVEHPHPDIIVLDNRSCSIAVLKCRYLNNRIYE